MSKTTQEWAALLTECGDRWELGDICEDGTRQLLEDGNVIGAIAMHVSQSEAVVAVAPEALEELGRLRWELETWRMRIEKERGAFKNSRHANRCDKLIATITRILNQEEK